MKTRNLPEITDSQRGIAIKPSKKTKREYKRVGERTRDGTQVLKKYGVITNSEQVLKEVQEAMRGEAHRQGTVIVKKMSAKRRAKKR